MAVSGINNGVDPNELHSLSQKVEPEEESRSFIDSLTGAFDKVNSMQLNANQAMEDLAVGRRKTLHETMIEVEKASVAFNLFMAVRGKVITAYQEVMRMHF
jgi:flagellar hook-basal body complex protein FliE